MRSLQLSHLFVGRMGTGDQSRRQWYPIGGNDQAERGCQLDPLSLAVQSAGVLMGSQSFIADRLRRSFVEGFMLGQSSRFALLGNCMISGIVFFAALGCSCAGVVEILAAPTLGAVVKSLCDTIVPLLFTVFIGTLFRRDWRNYRLARQSLHSNTSVAAKSHADDGVTCLECGKPMPMKGDTCSACGSSYTSFEEIKNPRHL